MSNVTPISALTLATISVEEADMIPGMQAEAASLIADLVRGSAPSEVS